MPSSLHLASKANITVGRSTLPLQPTKTFNKYMEFFIKTQPFRRDFIALPDARFFLVAYLRRLV